MALWFDRLRLHVITRDHKRNIALNSGSWAHRLLSIIQFTADYLGTKKKKILKAHGMT